MAVLLETSRGDLVLDLYVEECPLASRNFLKLCKIKYYNNCLFHNVQKDFIVQTGDPTGTGRGGMSISGVLYGEQARFFDDEIHPHVRHTKKGLVAMAGAGKDMNASQFYITTGAELDSLDGKHTIFGEVSEGMDVLEKINQAFVDDDGRPLQNVRIRHTIILDDPFPDPAQLADHIPDASPELVREVGGRLEDDWKPDEGDGRTADEIEEETRRHEAENRAVVLEMIGDLPEADAKPPSSMLFICKLNPVTTEEDLEIIFSRFGTITSCDIIRDWKTGDSLCYAFLGFDNDQSCEEAYFKMNNVLIDDRRIKVDFSQSVHHLWKSFRRFGRAGGKDEAAALGAVEGEGPEAPKRERFEVKSRGHQHGGGRYDLLLDADEGPPSRTARHERRSPGADRQRDVDRRPQGDHRGHDRQNGAHGAQPYAGRGGGPPLDRGGPRVGERVRGRQGEYGDADRRDGGRADERGGGPRGEYADVDRREMGGDRHREGAGHGARDVRERSRSRDRQRGERDGGPSRRDRGADVSGRYHERDPEDAGGSGRHRERDRDARGDRGREGGAWERSGGGRGEARDESEGERRGSRYGDGEEGLEVTARENGHRHGHRGGEVEDVREQKKEKHKDKKDGKDKHKHKHKEKDRRQD